MSVPRNGDIPSVVSQGQPDLRALPLTDVAHTSPALQLGLTPISGFSDQYCILIRPLLVPYEFAIRRQHQRDEG